MKAEERKHLKENELAERLGKVWQFFASGSTTNTIIWGVILVGLALAIGWRYYSDASARTRSALWSAVEQAYNQDELDRIIKENPGTVVARTANFHLNRFRLEDSLAGIAAPSSDERRKAADTLAQVRSDYAKLARESADEPELVQEALMGVAKCEEVLAGIPKGDDTKQPRGSLEEATKAYDDLAKRFPESYLGKQAARRVDELRNHTAQVRGFYDGLMDIHSAPSGPAPLPPAPPATPSGGPTLPDFPAIPEAKGDAPKPAAGATPPTVTPAPATPAPAPTTPAPTPNPPTAPPAGVSPEGPRPAPDQPKPKAP